MKNKKQYINKKFKHKYWVDRLVVTHRTYFPHLKLQDFKKTKIYFNKTSTHIYITPANDGPGVNVFFQSNHNLIRYTREYLEKISNFKRMGSHYKHSNNFIPHKLRELIKSQNLTHAKLRKKSCKKLFKRLKSIDKSFSAKLRRFSIKEKEVGYVSCLYSLNEVEICYDFATPRDIFLTHDEQFIESMQEHVCRYYEKNFINSEGKSNINSLYVGHGKERKAIYGETDHNTNCKLYVKEISSQNVLHRFENTFKKAQLQKYFHISFKNINELKDKFSFLADISFDLLYNIGNIEMDLSDSNLNEVIMSYCIEHFGKHWRFAFDDLTTGNKCIETGKKGKSNESVKRKARKLESEGCFIKKVEGKKALYNLDKNWIKEVCTL